MTTEKHDFHELRQAVAAFDYPAYQKRKAIAADLYASEAHRKQLCVALMGLTLEEDAIEFDKYAQIRRVFDRPGEIELAGALKDKTQLAAVARYSVYVPTELCVYGAPAGAGANLSDVAWWLTVAIRLRIGKDFLAAAAASCSWSAIAGAPVDSCSVQMIEDVPRARRFGTAASVNRTDVEWVCKHLPALVRLSSDQRFRLAVDCLMTHAHEASMRMVTASLWSGIEALFGVKAELTFRVSVYIASYLRPRGTERVAMFKRVKTLYGFRSKAVHGEPVRDSDVERHVAEVRELMREVLIRAIQDGELPSASKWDELLLA